MTNKNFPSEDKSLLRKKKINSCLLFLQNIFKELSDGKPHEANLTFYSKKENLTWWYGAQLVRSGILEKKENFIYVWKNLSKKPSLELAEKLYDDTLHSMRGYRNNIPPNKEKLVTNKFEKKDKIKIDNIKKFLDVIYPLMKGVEIHILAQKLKLQEQALKYKLRQNIIPSLIAIKTLSRVGNNNHNYAYKWMADAPTLKMAENVLSAEKEIGKAIRSRRNEREKKNERGPRGKYNKAEKPGSNIPLKDTSKKHLWKDIAHKAIDMDDPELALKALNKLS